MSQLMNPFPGLRPFRSDEDYLFFGREGQSDDLLRLLQRSRFMAVVGVSGSGKSSLVRAGLLPSLVGGLMTGAGSSWRIAMLRPGSDPMANLAHALLHPEQLAADEEFDEVADADTSASAREDAIRAAFVDAALRRGGLGLVEAAQQLNLAADEKLLVVVDQFEELFRYAAAGRVDDLIASSSPAAQERSAAFVRLLLEAARSELVPIYVAITMRSDFLGDCARFPDLPEAINQGQYLIPRMTRDQRRRAIEGPVAVGGASMRPRLVQRLLNDVGDSPDQLPILQHALMRTWVHWQATGSPDAPLDLPHYEATGGMAQALSNHADEVYRALPDEKSRRLIEQIFKGLTELGPDNRGVRRPASLAHLSELTGQDSETIKVVLEAFRRQDCAFIAPPAPTVLTADSTIDISHESLMRIWRRLDRWVAEEAQDAVWLRRIGDAASLHAQGQAGLWRDPQLALALAWQAEKVPTPAWATRYVANYAEGLAFLAASQEAQEAEARRAEEQARQELEHQRQLAELQRQRAEESEANANELRRASTRLLWLAGGLALALLAAILVVWFALDQRNLATARGLVSEARAQSDLRTATLLALEARRMAPRVHEANRLLTHDLLERDPLIYFDSVEDYIGHTSSVWSVAWSPDGERLASASDDRTIKLWDVESGQPLATLSGHTSRVLSVAWSPDGERLASASSDRTIKLWDVESGQPLATLSGHTSRVLSVAWSPDGERLASASSDRTIKLWDVESGQPLATLSGHTDWVWSVAWSPDGERLASASSDRTIKLWDVESGQPLATLSGHTSSVWSVAWSPDGERLASASDDRTIKLWDVESGQPLATLSGHTSRVLSVAWSPDGERLASASDDRTIKLWDVESGQPLATLSGHTSSVLSVAWSPDGERLASASDDRTIKLWDVESGQPLATLSGHTDWVWSVAWSPDGERLASASDDRTIKLWDVESGQPLATLSGHTSSVWSVAWSPDGERLASASSDRTIKLWDVESGQPLATLSGHTSSVWSVAWSPDGERLASASDDRTIKLWDVESGQPLATLSGHTSRVLSVAWSPDGERLASASDDRTIKLWDVESGQPLATLSGHTDWVWSVAWSPDGERLASASDDRTIKLWDVESGQPLATLSGHTDRVLSVAWSPDGERLASASDDRTIKLWDVESGQPLATLSGHTSSVWSVAWSPDGERLASASSDRTIKLWPVPLILDPCTMVSANLTPDEWTTYRQRAIYRRTCPGRPALPLLGVWEAIDNGKLDQLMVTWPRRLFLFSAGLLALALVALLLWGISAMVRVRRRAIFAAVVVLLLLGYAYIQDELFDIYSYGLVAVAGLILALLLWGVLRLLRWLWRKMRRRDGSRAELDPPSLDDNDPAD